MQLLLETEMAILGSVLYDPELLPRVRGALVPEDFFHPTHRDIYRTILDLDDRGMDPSVPTVGNELSIRERSAVAPQELFEMLEYRADLDSVLTMATQLSELSGYRLLERELEKLSKSAKDRELPLAEYITVLSDVSTAINNKGVKQEIMTGEELVLDYLAMLDIPRADSRLTGIEEIDSRIVDFDSKEITLIAARPGVGKTALLLQSARANLEQGKRVGFISMEMAANKVMNRLVSAEAKVDGTMIVTDKSIRDTPRFLEAVEYFRHAPLYIDDRGPFNNLTVPQKIRKMVYEHKCDVVYVDYIGLINATGELSRAQRNYQLTQISSDIKGLASELDIPIVAAAQLNRDVAKRMSNRPTLADLRDSGALEQDASLVLFIYPEVENAEAAGLSRDDAENYLQNSSEINVTIEVAKQRNGEVFSETVVMQKQFGIFASQARLRGTY